MQVESLTNQEEVELRSKIQALGLEVTKVPSKSTQNLDEVGWYLFWFERTVFSFFSLYFPIIYLFLNGILDGDCEADG